MLSMVAMRALGSRAFWSLSQRFSGSFRMASRRAVPIRSRISSAAALVKVMIRR